MQIHKIKSCVRANYTLVLIGTLIRSINITQAGGEVSAARLRYIPLRRQDNQSSS